MTQRRLGLIVTDASPLITLGAARALSCLLMPRVQVLIPEMVYAEVMRDMAKLGAEGLLSGCKPIAARCKLRRRQFIPSLRLC